MLSLICYHFLNTFFSWPLPTCCIPQSSCALFCIDLLPVVNRQCYLILPISQCFPKCCPFSLFTILHNVWSLRSVSVFLFKLIPFLWCVAVCVASSHLPIKRRVGIRWKNESCCTIVWRAVFASIHCIGDICNWTAHISNWIADISNWLADISKSIQWINVKTARAVFTFIHWIAHICNWIGYIFNWIGDISNWIADISNWIADISKFADLEISTIELQISAIQL